MRQVGPARRRPKVEDVLEDVLRRAVGVMVALQVAAVSGHQLAVMLRPDRRGGQVTRRSRHPALFLFEVDPREAAGAEVCRGTTGTPMTLSSLSSVCWTIKRTLVDPPGSV